MPFRVAAEACYLVAICWRAFVCGCLFCLWCCLCVLWLCLVEVLCSFELFCISDMRHEFMSTEWLCFRKPGFAFASHAYCMNSSNSHILAESVFSSAYRLTCESLQIIFATVIIQYCSTNCSLQHVMQWVDAFGSHASNLEFCPGLHNHRTFEFRPGSEFCQGSESLKGEYARHPLRPLMRGSRALYYMYISYSHTLDCLHLWSDCERRLAKGSGVG